MCRALICAHEHVFGFGEAQGAQHSFSLAPVGGDVLAASIVEPTAATECPSEQQRELSERALSSAEDTGSSQASCTLYVHYIVARYFLHVSSTFRGKKKNMPRDNDNWAL